MSFDGIFIHHLIKELKTKILNERINKVHVIDKTTFIFALSNKQNLLISISLDSAHLRLTKMTFVPATITFPIATLLKKYFEGAIITDINQISNDRIIEIKVNSFNDFGFSKEIKLVLELFGRNTNLIILDSENIIMDASRKTFELDSKIDRIIYPKVKYTYPKAKFDSTSNLINPFDTEIILPQNNYLGVSQLLFHELNFRNNLNIIKQETKPVLIKLKEKYYFYCFELFHLNGEFTYFSSLSELLEEYYLNIKQIANTNNEQKQIENYLKKELIKVTKKLEKQNTELNAAKENLNLEQIGNLLSANLYQVKKNMSEITLLDFYHNNQEIKISLNPLLSPSKNLENIFNKYKKAKRSILHLEEQIPITENEINYLNTLFDQLVGASANDLKEIMEELKLGKKQVVVKRKQKPSIHTYKTKNDAIIMVGKNNIQNNYLTHTLANKNDIFFHVKNVPGSHTILRCEDLTDELIMLTATIAASYSKSKNSENVAVDYTLVRNVKKVSGQKGSFVTYTNYKTVYVTPNSEVIKNSTI